MILTALRANYLPPAIARYIVRWRQFRLPAIILLGMKLTLFFTALLVTNLHAGVFSQRVSITAENVKLEQVFNEIRKQTGYIVFYDYDLVSNCDAVSLKVENITLPELLEMVLKVHKLSYSIEKETIAIRKAARKPVAKVTDMGVSTLDEWVRKPPVTIKGKVIGEDNESLEGVSVVVKGSSKATSTNADGSFELRNVDENATLIISGVNIETQEVRIEGRNNLVIKVKRRIAEAEAVTFVSNGYQRIPLDRITGSFTHISAADLEKSNSFSLKDRLEGLVPGMFFESNYDEDQNPTSERSKSIVIRGVGTFSNNNPLIVIDGSPYFSDVMDPWTLINPDDVESISVLKDAAAASIWGASASGGVIVITTKKGTIRKGQPSLNFGLDYLVKPTPDLMSIPWANSREAIEIYKEVINNHTWYDSLNPVIKRYEYPEVMTVISDMKFGNISEAEGNKRLQALGQIDVRREFKDLFFNGVESMSKINLSFQSGTDIHNVLTSLSGTFKQGYAKNNSDYLLSLNIKDEFKPKKWLKFGLTTNINLIKEKLNGVVVNDLATIPQMSRILDNNGNYLPMIYSGSPHNYYGFAHWNRADTVEKYDLHYNWDYNLKQDKDNSDKTQTKSNIRIIPSVQINPIKGLSLELSYTYQKDHSLRREYYNENTWYVRDMVNTFTDKDGKFKIPPGGMVYFLDEGGFSYNLRSQITYNRSIGSHSIRALTGFEQRKAYADRIPYGYYAYDPQSLNLEFKIDYATDIEDRRNGLPAGTWKTVPAVPTTTFGVFPSGVDRRDVSNFGNVGYTFKNKYDVTASARIDRTNLFGQTKEYRNLPQWSVGAAWRLSDEIFFKSELINLFRVRFSYGFNGLVDRSASPFIQGYPWTDPLMQIPYMAVQSAPNPSLTWEKTGVYNLGVDYSLLKNRITGIIEVYKKHAKNVLVQTEVNGTYGFQNNRATFNSGTIINNGFEFSVNARIIEKGPVLWRSSFNYGTNRNRASDFTQVSKNTSAYTTLSFYYHIPNQPVDYLAAVEWKGYDEAGYDQFMYQGKEMSVREVANSSTLNVDDLFIIVGQKNPKHFGQFSHVISYKNIDFNISLLYKFGHKFVGDYPASSMANTYFTPTRLHTYFPELLVNRWKGPESGDNASMYSINDKISANQAGFLDMVARYNTRNVMNAGHIRLKSLALAYRIPARYTGAFKNVRFNFEARNLKPLLLLNSQKVDPEFTPYSSSVYGALMYPIRNRPEYSIGLKFGL